MSIPHRFGFRVIVVIGVTVVIGVATDRLAGVQASSTLGGTFTRQILEAALPESAFDLRFFSTAVKTDSTGRIITSFDAPPPHRIVGAEFA